MEWQLENRLLLLSGKGDRTATRALIQLYRRQERSDDIHKVIDALPVVEELRRKVLALSQGFVAEFPLLDSAKLALYDQYLLPEEVAWVGELAHGVYCSWDEFEVLAGAVDDERSRLVLVGPTWWFERRAVRKWGFYQVPSASSLKPLVLAEAAKIFEDKRPPPLWGDAAHPVKRKSVTVPWAREADDGFEEEMFPTPEVDWPRDD